MIDLDVIHRQLVFEVQEGLGIVASVGRAVDFGFAIESLSSNLQALGICHLLEFADQAQFRENLTRSGHARRYYLKKSRDQQNINDSHLGLSRTEAFFDAVAAGDLSLAGEIADLSTTEWNSDWEYEDDFCYYSFLHDLFRATDDGGTDRLRATLNRFERALEGADSPRLRVCLALLSGDENLFLDSFQTLLDLLLHAHDKKRQIVESYELTFWPRSFVSIEAIALLRIAELKRLAVPERGFVLCPALARLPAPGGGSTRDLFAEIDRHIATAEL